MSALGHHLVRRGLESVTQTIKAGGVDDDDGNTLKLSIWHILLFAVTAVLFVVVLFCVCLPQYRSMSIPIY